MGETLWNRVIVREERMKVRRRYVVFSKETGARKQTDGPGTKLSS